MKVQINSNWEKLLNSEFRKPYFTDLVDFVKNAYSKTVCYPPGKDIFDLKYFATNGPNTKIEPLIVFTSE